MSGEPLWLQAARRYIGVAEIPGKETAPVISRWLKRLGAWWDEDATPWCFRGETEIFTDIGWQRLDALDAERVYQADETGALSLTAYHRVEKDHAGEAFEITHRHVRLVCDTRHRWWGSSRAGETPRFLTLDAVGVNGLSIPTVHSDHAGGPWTPDQLWLLAAFVSDGKYRYANGKRDGRPWSIEFEVSRERKIHALRALTPQHEYTQRMVYGDRTRTPLTVFRFVWPEFFEFALTDYKRLSHAFINSLSREQAAEYLRAYSHFDGNAADGATLLYTSDRGILDDLMAVATLAGYHSSPQNRARSELSRRDPFALAFSHNKRTRTIKPHHIARIDYVGKLFCVTVPQGRIVVRAPDGGPVVTGNCGTFVAACLDDVGLPRPQHWYRARAYLDYGTSVPAPTLGCIVVFARTGGGHVGFAVGRNEHGALLILGGNQGDRVSIAAFDPARVLGYRWPPGAPYTSQPLARYVGNFKLSTNEA